MIRLVKYRDGGSIGYLDVLSCDYFTACDYNVTSEALRYFVVRGERDKERAVSFINDALSDGLTVETIDGYGVCVTVVGVD